MKYLSLAVVVVLSSSFFVFGQDGSTSYKDIHKLKGVKGFSVVAIGRDRNDVHSGIFDQSYRSIDEAYITMDGTSHLIEQKVYRAFKQDKKIILITQKLETQELELTIYKVGEDRKLFVEKHALPPFTIADDFKVQTFSQYSDPQLGEMMFFQVFEQASEESQVLKTYLLSNRGLYKSWELAIKDVNHKNNILKKLARTKFEIKDVINIENFKSDKYLVLTKDYKVSRVQIEQVHKRFLLREQAKLASQKQQAQLAQMPEPTRNEKALAVKQTVKKIESSLSQVEGLETLKLALAEQLQSHFLYREVEPMIIMEGQGSLVDELLNTLNTKDRLAHAVIDFKMMDWSAAETANTSLNKFNQAMLDVREGGYVSLKNWEYASSKVKEYINKAIKAGEHDVPLAVAQGEAPRFDKVYTRNINFLKRTTLGLENIQDYFAQATNDVSKKGLNMSSREAHQAIYDELFNNRIQRDGLMRRLVSGTVTGNAYQARQLSFLDEDVTKAARIEVAFPQTQYEFVKSLDNKFKILKEAFKTEYPGAKLRFTSRKDFLLMAEKIYNPSIDSSFSERVMSEVRTQLASKALNSFSKGNSTANLKLDLKYIVTLLKSDCNSKYF